MQHYYNDACCTQQLSTDNALLKKVKNAFNTAVKHLHGKGRFTPAMLKDKPIKQLIDETNNVLAKAVDIGIKHQMPEHIRASLSKDVFIFSGMKTYTELKEASQLLLDQSGNIKPWHSFRQDVLGINEKYNQQYLQAEYNYAIGAAQMADKWQDLEQDADRYYLQYRTAGDTHVRPQHAAMNRITLPASDPFWNKYYPPNGWNCRCTAVKVLRSKYAVSNSNDAIALGEAATTRLDKNGNNADTIFRFNPGKQAVIFPPQHPYYPQHCNGAKLNVTGLIGKAQIVLANENDKCKAKSIIELEFDKAKIKQAPALSREEQKIIFELPVEKQYTQIKIGDKNIFVHKAFFAGEDYNDLIDAAEHFIQQDKTVYILPIIHSKDIASRNKIFVGYNRTKTSPDIFVKEDNQYWEVEKSLGTPRRNVAERVKSGVKQADNVYLILQNDAYKKYAEEQLQDKAKAFHIVIKKENQQ